MLSNIRLRFYCAPKESLEVEKVGYLLLVVLVSLVLSSLQSGDSHCEMFVAHHICDEQK